MWWYNKLLLLLILFVGGCGYHLMDHSPMVLPGNIKKIYISNIKNPTSDVQLSSLMHTSLIDEFSKRSMPIEWSQRDNAEGILKVEIVDFSKKTYVENSKEQTLKSDLCLTIRGYLYDQQDRLLWDSREIKQCESIPQNVSDAEISKAREKVIKDISIEMAMSLSQKF